MNVGDLVIISPEYELPDYGAWKTQLQGLIDNAAIGKIIKAWNNDREFAVAFNGDDDTYSYKDDSHFICDIHEIELAPVKLLTELENAKSVIAELLGLNKVHTDTITAFRKYFEHTDDPDAYAAALRSDDPDPDAYYAEIERQHHETLDQIESEREEQQFFDDNEDYGDGDSHGNSSHVNVR